MQILGLSAFYHDSAAAMLADGQLVAAAQEERFSREKHDMRFPGQAISYCLQEAGCDLQDLDGVVFYDKPLIKFERLLETYLSFAPRGFSSFVMAMPAWLKDKLFLKATLKKELAALAGCHQRELPRLYFSEHHEAHAASAFYPSPFEEAAVLCLDGVGEWAATSTWHGKGGQLEPLWQMDFPHSLGLLYSAFTYFTGFKVNSGEYKLMGLAPYGEPVFTDLIYEHLLDLKDDGTFRLNMDYFGFATSLRMTNERFARLFGGARRKPESQLTQREMDLARSVQVVTEEIVLRLGRTLQAQTGLDQLCLAGGVALNCVANGRLLREGPFKQIWLQPAAGDAGGAVGAAYCLWHGLHQQPRPSPDGQDSTGGSYLGPGYTTEEVCDCLDRLKAPYEVYAEDDLLVRVAQLVADGQVVGWFHGRMEFGPRALGGRSIIGDPRNRRMQSTMNLKIKYRESFRPFAPAVLAEKVGEWFQLDTPSPYMLVVADVHPDKMVPLTNDEAALTGLKKLSVSRSEIPAVTHVDGSARVQTVHAETNPRFHRLLQVFDGLTGCPVLINTSFNVRGEPIVCTPEDAYRCFMRTEMDVLVLEDALLLKTDQPAWEKDTDWQEEFALD